MQRARGNDVMKRITISALAIGVFCIPFSFAKAQGRAEANCTYEACALGIAPVWNGLAITKGERQETVATLGFFYPTDVASVFAGNDAAIDAANDAVRTRTIAAALTDAGIVLVGTGIARGIFQRHIDGLSQALAFSGAASLAVSVPFQFSADGLLSRAVWLYNRKFAR
jgi:hypothetical protein